METQDQNNWTCAIPCQLATDRAAVSVVSTERAALPTFVRKNYPNADWLPSPSLPPPRSA